MTGSRPSDGAASSTASPPFGFDPARIAGDLSEAQRRCVKVLGAEFKTPPRGHAYWAGTMLYGHKLTRFRYVGSLLNRREYCLTTLGLAVKAAIAGEAQRAETGNTGSAGTASTRAEGIAQTQSDTNEESE